MIEVRNVSKSYGPVRAVDGLSFTVSKGEILGFLGPNGAGKTTTMRMVTGFLPPSDGTAIVSGFDVVQSPLEVKRRIGYLPEAPPLYPEMTVRDYLDFVARLKGLASQAERNRHVDRAIERCALSDVRERLTERLSKGFRQRVGLAQAIVHEPSVLILDEPTAGLDPKQITETRELIRSLAGDHTIILSTHILPEVNVTCQRVVIINKGRLVAEDTPEALGRELLLACVRASEPQVTAFMSRFTDDVAAGSNIAIEGYEVSIVSDEVCRIEIQIHPEADRDIRAELARELVRSGFDLLELRTAGASLEQVFLQLTTEETPNAHADDDAQDSASSGPED